MDVTAVVALPSHPHGKYVALRIAPSVCGQKTFQTEGYYAQFIQAES